jgi:HAD superfamily hydrolase (TIGR01549 family)
VESSTNQNPVLARQHWVFDMDGTLTQSVHDFEAIRSELGIKSGAPIIEALNALPVSVAAPLWVRLDELELDYAKLAKPMPYAVELLECLHQRGAKFGILTRNTMAGAHHTLQACGMDKYFESQFILDRDGAEPKPSGDGIIKLMSQWQSIADDTVMVGDYYYDLKAGRNAEVATIHIDPEGQFVWPDETDMAISCFSELKF